MRAEPVGSVDLVGSIHTVVADSTHVIPLDRPDAVVEAIRQVVTAVREKRPLRAEK